MIEIRGDRDVVRVVCEGRNLVTLGELLRGRRLLRHSSRDQCRGALCNLIRP